MEKNTIIESVKAGMLVLLVAFQIGIVSELAMVNSSLKKNNHFERRPQMMEERTKQMPPSMMQKNNKKMDKKRGIHRSDFVMDGNHGKPGRRDFMDNARHNRKHGPRFAMNGQNNGRKDFMKRPEMKHYEFGMDRMHENNQRNSFMRRPEQRQRPEFVVGNQKSERKDFMKKPERKPFANKNDANRFPKPEQKLVEQKD